MITRELVQKIHNKFLGCSDGLNYARDMFDALRYLDAEEKDKAFAHEMSRELRQELAERMGHKAYGAAIKEAFELYRELLLFDSKECFDSFMLFVEIDRPAKERFYMPRRKKLLKVVNALQRLADDELDELFLSCPPRIGKTTLLRFFALWIMGRNSELSNLYCAFSDAVTSVFYNGVVEVLTDRVTYKFYEVFPTAKVATQNSKDETLNLDRLKTYPSLTARSLYGTLNGACDCNGILIADDLISGIDEAMNKTRLARAWYLVDNNMLTRAKEHAKILWVGTRWSMYDPIGIRMELLTTDATYIGRRIEIINTPALDDHDESNFDYDYGVGFSTQYYRERRASFEKNNDIASWNAQYMGMPIEREGTLFSPADIKTFNGVLPEGEPDAKISVVDPAWGGGDFVAAPMCYVYGDLGYVVDVVYDNSTKNITQPMIANAYKRNDIRSSLFEVTKMTEEYKEGVGRCLDEIEHKVMLCGKPAPTNKGKEQRIFEASPDIRERLVFLESSKRSGMYERFMMNVFSFKLNGKNEHDDAPDSLAMLVNFMHPKEEVKIFRRFF